jgi:uncharacterized membrane protein YphA (DoxX/SURF4 family)
MTILKTIERLFIRTQTLDFLPLLAIRLYLIPIFYEGAHAKLTGFGALVEWFGAPAVAGRAAYARTAADGGACHGDRNRRLHLPRSGPVHAPDLGAADGDDDGGGPVGTLVARLGGDRGQDRGIDAAFPGLHGMAGPELPGRFNYITELGDPIILNNGIEFTVTYVILLAVLFFRGGGRWVSLDYWLARGPLNGSPG